MSSIFAMLINISYTIFMRNYIVPKFLHHILKKKNPKVHLSCESPKDVLNMGTLVSDDFSYTQINHVLNFVQLNQIWTVITLSQLFWHRINWKSAITIQLLFDWTRFRKDFSVYITTHKKIMKNKSRNKKWIYQNSLQS